MIDPGVALRRALERLHSTDPVVREEAIKTLEMLGDTNALPALSEVFATDVEAPLRAMAQNAGKAIYYGAIRQRLEEQGASEQERRQAADILSQARAKKIRGKRKR